MIPSLVSADWLNEHKNDPKLIILDASPATTASSNGTRYPNLTIPNARFFDLKNVFSDNTSKFPNTFPSVEQFETGCRSLGIDRTSKIVVYDNLGIYTSPRVWWMFRTMGHQEVAVLNGGLTAWIAAGHDTSSHHLNVTTNGDFSANFNQNGLADIDFIEANLDRTDHLIVDARSRNRFLGIAKEPRAGLRSGHIPNSVNVPFESVLDHGKLKSKEELTAIFHASEIDHRPLIFSCGSGITACIVLLAAHEVLPNETSVYDGSWTEWATLK